MGLLLEAVQLYSTIEIKIPFKTPYTPILYP